MTNISKEAVERTHGQLMNTAALLASQRFQGWANPLVVDCVNSTELIKALDAERDALSARVEELVADFNDAVSTLHSCRDRVEELESALKDVREEICRGPVNDVLWHRNFPSETTVDFICNTLGDDWDYDEWLESREALKRENTND